MSDAAMSNLSFKEKVEVFMSNRYVAIITPLFFLVLVGGIFAIPTEGKILSLNVLKGIFNQSLIVGTLAIAVSFIYSCGDLDISIGAVMALASTLGAFTFNMTGSIVLTIVITIVVGIVLMAFNCTCSAVLNIRTITVAIIMMQIYSAVQVKLLGATANIQIDYQVAKMLENEGFRIISFLAYFIFCFVVYQFTFVGRSLRFIGGNPTCARQTGMSKVKLQYLAFLIAGLGIGLAGIYTLIRSASVSDATGAGMGMNCMLATVLGGMSIFGGSKSNSYAGLIGALIVVTLNKGLLMIGVSSTIIQGIRGIIFLLLVYVNSEKLKLLPSRQHF